VVITGYGPGVIRCYLDLSFHLLFFRNGYVRPNSNIQDEKICLFFGPRCLWFLRNRLMNKSLDTTERLNWTELSNDLGQRLTNYSLHTNSNRTSCFCTAHWAKNIIYILKSICKYLHSILHTASWLAEPNVFTIMIFKKMFANPLSRPEWQKITFLIFFPFYGLYLRL